LRDAGVRFYALAVVTADTLENPDAFIDFFLDIGVPDLGLNFEEVEGVHQQSTLHAVENETRFARFVERLYLRYQSIRDRIRIREFEQVEAALRDSGTGHERSQLRDPFGIVTVGVDGSWSTFAPEMLTMGGIDRPFVYGNVLEEPFESPTSLERVLAVRQEIECGIATCRASCEYFLVCGGGSPSNKYSEQGRLDISETRHCRFKHQILPDTVLKVLQTQ
jgi:uncharacterized protein